MVFHIMQWKKYTAFYRGMRGHSVPHQKKLVRAYVQRRGGQLLSEYTADIQSSTAQRDEWIFRARRDEVAIVAGLFVIPEGAAAGRRPSADLVGAMLRLGQRAGLIVDAVSGLTSDDGDKWANLAEQHTLKVNGGRRLTRADAVEMHRKSRRARGPDVVAQWAAPNMARERKRWAQWWRDPQFPSAQHAYDAMLAAFDALPDEDKPPPIGGLSTARKIFGRREPGEDLGRPPKKRKSKRKL